MSKKKEASPPAETGSDTEKQLNEKQLNELRAIDNKAVQTRLKLADLVVQLAVAEQSKFQLIQELSKLSAEYNVKVGKFAAMLGIDTESKPEETGVQWAFNGQAFTKSAYIKPAQ